VHRITKAFLNVLLNDLLELLRNVFAAQCKFLLAINEYRGSGRFAGAW
jgi:hypothetical protein